MFGYIGVYKNDLKYSEYATYKAYYCGLCMRLRQKYGLTATATLTYDMTSLILVLNSLYETEQNKDKCTCITNPLSKKTVYVNEITDYAADMNILLTYCKCVDDWQDEKKPAAMLAIRMFHKRYLYVKKKYPEKSAGILKSLKKLSYYEKHREKDIDKVAGCFGELMEYLFEYKNDIWTDIVKEFAYNMGKFIYIMDAYDDMEKDKKENSYNVLNYMYKDFKRHGRTDEDFENTVEDILIDVMAEATAQFEKLPCLRHENIINNILYAGVWNKYYKINEQKNTKQTGESADK